MQRSVSAVPRSGPAALPVLRIRGLTRSYGPRVVLAGVDLELAAGTVTALAGGNGTGKSTLLRCVAGLARHGGQVEVGGRPIARARELVGYLPQSVALPDWPTVDEVVALFVRLRRTDAAAARLPAGFLPPGDAPLGTLSGGQRQRVAIAVALLGVPKLLLLDEPAANLDRAARRTLWRLVGERVDAGAAALVATPAADDLDGLVDRFVRIEAGRLRDSGSPCHRPRRGTVLAGLGLAGLDLRAEVGT